MAFQNKCVMIFFEVNSMENNEEERGYVPRPAWQVWAARVGVVLFIALVIYQYFRIMRGGL